MNEHTKSPAHRANLYGVGAMLAAMFCYITNDMFVKLASDNVARQK